MNFRARLKLLLSDLRRRADSMILQRLSKGFLYTWRKLRGWSRILIFFMPYLVIVNNTLTTWRDWFCVISASHNKTSATGVQHDHQYQQTCVIRIAQFVKCPTTLLYTLRQHAPIFTRWTLLAACLRLLLGNVADVANRQNVVDDSWFSELLH